MRWNTMVFMRAKRQKSQRVIYDQNYYKAQAMLRDPWFKKKVKWLTARFTEVGCPLPEGGFKKYAQYEKWREKFWDTHSRMSQDDGYKARVAEITGGKKKITLDEYNAVEVFRERYLPPLYGAVIGDILEHFKIDRHDRQFHQFIELYIFLGKTDYPTTLFNVKWIRNQKTDQMELFIQLFGHTKKEDLLNNWDFISRDQHYLPGYLGKSKKWETFDRDLEIYTAYKALKDPNIKRSSNGKALDYKMLQKVSEKWPELTITRIRSIVTKTAKRLGEM